MVDDIVEKLVEDEKSTTGEGTSEKFDLEFSITNYFDEDKFYTHDDYFSCEPRILDAKAKISQTRLDNFLTE